MAKPEFDIEKLKRARMLKKKEAAFYIGVSTRTLERIIRSGDFYPLVRIGHGRGTIFVNREKLDQWINEQDASIKCLPR